MRHPRVDFGSHRVRGHRCGGDAVEPPALDFGLALLARRRPQRDDVAVHLRREGGRWRDRAWHEWGRHRDSRWNDDRRRRACSPVAERHGGDQEKSDGPRRAQQDSSRSQ